MPAISQSRAIEQPTFPFEELSKIAEHESWRKEVNRPIYHIHKWWAQRLGSVFRALVLGTFSSSDADILDLFYKPSRIGDVVVFDPFMGSGTTLGEVLKLGGRAVGQDINPVSYFLVKNGLNLLDRDEVVATFRQIEADTAQRILKFYSAKLPDGPTGPCSTISGSRSLTAPIARIRLTFSRAMSSRSMPIPGDILRRRSFVRPATTSTVESTMTQTAYARNAISSSVRLAGLSERVTPLAATADGHFTLSMQSKSVANPQNTASTLN